MLAYAPPASRAALAALWRLDERLGRIVGSAREAMVAAITLAWWREALEALDRDPAPAEPLLQEIAETILPAGVRGAELALIEAGWAALLTADPIDDATIEAHGRERGRPLFSLAARLLTGATCEQAEQAGEGWALADLGRRLGGTEAAGRARAKAAQSLARLGEYRWPVALRPLGGLAMLARKDSRSSAAPPQGSPGRILRLLLHRLTGR